MVPVISGGLVNWVSAPICATRSGLTLLVLGGPTFTLGLTSLLLVMPPPLRALAIAVLLWLRWERAAAVVIHVGHSAVGVCGLLCIAGVVVMDVFAMRRRAGLQSTGDALLGRAAGVMVFVHNFVVAHCFRSFSSAVNSINSRNGDDAMRGIELLHCVEGCLV